MLDLLVTNANLPDGRTGISIAVQNGRIVEVAPHIDATSAQQRVDAALRVHAANGNGHVDVGAGQCRRGKAAVT